MTAGTAEAVADEPVPGSGGHDGPAAAALPSDPRAAWLAGSAAVGGLAVDFASAARSVEWRDEGLVVSLPADATTAAAFLRRPEVTRGLAASLTALAGRPIRYTISVDPPATGPMLAAASPPRPTSAATQAARLKAAADHPLVARARAVFDAAIRTVEPPRRAEEGMATPAVAGRVAAHEARPSADADERDLSVSDDDTEGMLDG